MMPTAFGSFPEYELEVVLPTAVSLGPGTYWIEIFAETPELLEWFGSGRGPWTSYPSSARIRASAEGSVFRSAARISS